MVLDYLKVILTWPVIGGGLIGAFLFLFKSQIGSLISRVGRIKFPGGELTTSQQEKIELVAPGPVTPSKDPELPKGLHLNPDQMAQVEGYVHAQRAAAYLWEYRYLNFFLAKATQNVLDWLVSLKQSTTIGAYEAMWMHAIQLAEERNAILHALQMHVLVEITGEIITVTPKGREYAAWPERRTQQAATPIG